MSANVYFKKDITPEKVLELFKAVKKPLDGKVAIKVHSGEKGNQNFLKPDFWRPVVDFVGGTVVECNTAYEGARNTTERHLKLFADHGWSRYFDVDLLDASGPDLCLKIPNGKVIKENYVGKSIANYDSMLVLSSSLRLAKETTDLQYLHSPAPFPVTVSLLPPSFFFS